jgi:predicted RNA binding protein YcfA (HicA-like mRNA interferase family)
MAGKKKVGKKHMSRKSPALRPIHYKTLAGVFERDGFTFDHQRGDHLIYTKPGVKRPLVIPAYHEIPVFIIKNLLRTAEMSRGRYFELLQDL